MKKNLMYGLVTILMAFLIVGFFTIAQENVAPEPGAAAPAGGAVVAAPAPADLPPNTGVAAPAEPAKPAAEQPKTPKIVSEMPAEVKPAAAPEVVKPAAEGEVAKPVAEGEAATPPVVQDEVAKPATVEVKPVAEGEAVVVVNPTAEGAAEGEVSKPVAEGEVVAVQPGETVLVELPKEKQTPMTGITATPSTNVAPVTGENLLTVTFDDAQLADVIKMFTRISKANIIANVTNLQGRVTASLTDVEWKPALEAILDMHGLGLIEKTPNSGVYSIVIKAGQAEPMVVETIFIKYAAVSNVASVVTAMVAPYSGTVSPFPSRNALVVRSTSASISEIKALIAKIDKIRDQVYIEAKFMELSDDAVKQLGINWKSLGGDKPGEGLQWSLSNVKMDLKDTRQRQDYSKDQTYRYDMRRNTDTYRQAYDENGQPVDAVIQMPMARQLSPAAPAAVPGGTAQRTVSDSTDMGVDRTSDRYTTIDRTVDDVRSAVLAPAQFNAVLSALKKTEGISIVSNPKILVANEEAAIIHIGETRRPFISSVTPGQQGIAPVVTYSPGEKLDTGVILTVTPTVNTSSNITVKIVPELSSIISYDTSPNGDEYPIITTKKINSVFCLESGKTVALGGLSKTEQQETTAKIPLLGNIPILGKYLFSHTYTKKSQDENIIFVTVALADPQTVNDDVGLPEDTELAQRHVLRTQIRKSDYESALKKEKEATEKAIKDDDKKAKARLLKSKE